MAYMVDVVRVPSGRGWSAGVHTWQQMIEHEYTPYHTNTTHQYYMYISLTIIQTGLNMYWCHVFTVCNVNGSVNSIAARANRCGTNSTGETSNTYKTSKKRLTTTKTSHNDILSYNLSSVCVWLVYYYFSAHPRARIEVGKNSNNSTSATLLTAGKQVSRTRKQV